jgi:DNA-binding CsgD family transcriptional regulator
MPRATRTIRRRNVTPIRPLTPLEAGQAALASGRWTDAKRHFQAALARTRLAEAYEGLGLAAWWLDREDLALQSRQQAYRLYRGRDDRAAARVAVWLAWDAVAFRGERAIANGWLKRAHRLLDGEPDCPERAWLAVREGILALLEDADPNRALSLADDAIRVARASGAIDFEMIGGALRGFALVTAGQVPAGMGQLDDVNAAVLAGELTDPVAIALTCCYLVAACERVRDADRAGQWCHRLKRFCTTWGLRPLLAVCRTQYASMCVWRGDWAEAEKELVTATRELQSSRPAMSGEGLARFGELRRRQGRFGDAATLFDRAGHHPIAQLGRIALSLDRGESRKAIDLADRYLRQMPEHNRTERAHGLEYLARAGAGAGDLAGARRASRDLDAIARAVGIPPFEATASIARGYVAIVAGDQDAARRYFEDAVDWFDRCGAPFETARARLDLARALGRLGQTPAALEEVRLAVGALDGIDAAFELSQAQALQKQLESTAPRRARTSSAGLTRRELEVVRLIAGGYSNHRIGQRLFISSHTVHRHVANLFDKLHVRSRSAVVAKAAASGLLV